MYFLELICYLTCRYLFFLKAIRIYHSFAKSYGSTIILLRFLRTVLGYPWLISLPSLLGLSLVRSTTRAPRVAPRAWAAPPRDPGRYTLLVTHHGSSGPPYRLQKHGYTRVKSSKPTWIPLKITILNRSTSYFYGKFSMQPAEFARGYRSTWRVGRSQNWVDQNLAQLLLSLVILGVCWCCMPHVRGAPQICSSACSGRCLLIFALNHRLPNSNYRFLHANKSHHR